MVTRREFLSRVKGSRGGARGIVNPVLALRVEEVTVIRLLPFRHWVRLLLTLVLTAAATAGLAACNTVAGAGKDVSNTGTAISNTAQTVQQKM